MYAKYQEAVDALRHEQLGRKESEAVLQRVWSQQWIYSFFEHIQRYMYLSLSFTLICSKWWTKCYIIPALPSLYLQIMAFMYLHFVFLPFISCWLATVDRELCCVIIFWWDVVLLDAWSFVYSLVFSGSLWTRGESWTDFGWKRYMLLPNYSFWATDFCSPFSGSVRETSISCAYNAFVMNMSYNLTYFLFFFFNKKLKPH